MIFYSKISSQGDPKSVFEPRNPSVKCISASSTQTQEFVRVGWQHGPMLAFKIPENCSPGGVRSLEESPETFLGGSRRLCGASREVWEGCRRFWKGSGEVLGGPGRGAAIQRRADFRSLKR